MTKFLTLILLAAISVAAKAQDAESVYRQVVEAYEMGHFETVDSLLTEEKVRLLNNEQRIDAYRVLALSWLYRDKPEKAEVYAGKLLAIDPFYTAYGESPRLIDMIERLKNGGNSGGSACARDAYYERDD